MHRKTTIAEEPNSFVKLDNETQAIEYLLLHSMDRWNWVLYNWLLVNSENDILAINIIDGAKKWHKIYLDTSKSIEEYPVFYNKQIVDRLPTQKINIDDTNLLFIYNKYGQDTKDNVW